MSPLSDLPRPYESMSGLYRVVPVKTRHKVHVTWQLPTQLRNWECKPTEFVGHLVGHEGRGSLLSRLKDQGLATAVCAGSSGEGYDTNTFCEMFTVRVDLRESAFGRWREALECIFGYLRMLRDVQVWPRHLYEEVRREERTFGFRAMNPTKPPPPSRNPPPPQSLLFRRRRPFSNDNPLPLLVGSVGDVGQDEVRLH